VLIGAGQKMYLGRQQARHWMRHVAAHTKDLKHVELFVLPSFVWLLDALELLSGTHIRWGAQNVHWEDTGPWTGEVSPLMVKETGATIVEIGHSERRTHFGETDETVNKKVLAALDHGLTPLVCIGEAERNEKLASETLPRQLAAVFREVREARWPEVVIAYEPVWAIGKDRPADIPYLRERFEQLRTWLTGSNPRFGERVKVLYGGSVDPDSTPELLSLPHIGGLFIGRAALDPDAFCKMAALADDVARKREVG